MQLIDKEDTKKSGERTKQYGNVEVTDAEIAGVSEWFSTKYHTLTLEHDKKTIWVYRERNGCYTPNGIDLIEQIYGTRIGWDRPSIMSRIHLHIRGLSKIEADKFENSNQYINLKNCVYDILARSGNNEHNHKYKFKYILPMEFDYEAKCPNFDKVLKDTFPKLEDRRLIMRWFAYHFVSGRREAKSLFIFGPPESFKSTLLEILREFLGAGTCSSYKFKDIAEDKNYSVAGLYGKLANINFDLGVNTIQEISMFKQLTSRDPVTVRAIYRDSITFRNKCKFTFACNTLPHLPDNIINDDAWWRRVMVLETKKNYKKRDHNLYYKMIDELPGIFNRIRSELEEISIEPGNLFRDKDYRDIWIENMYLKPVGGRPVGRPAKIIEEDTIDFEKIKREKIYGINNENV